MLPDGFYWAPRCHLSKVADGLFLDREPVAFLIDKVDGQSWFASLDVHRGMDHPLRIRHCTSFEAGRLGCEVWASRHVERLRREVAAKIAARPANRWAARSARSVTTGAAASREG